MLIQKISSPGVASDGEEGKYLFKPGKLSVAFCLQAATGCVLILGVVPPPKCQRSEGVSGVKFWLLASLNGDMKNVPL